MRSATFRWDVKARGCTHLCGCHHAIGVQDFRKLRVWQRAHELSLAVKHATKTFPRSVAGDAKWQLIRAADSIVSNIVEGCGAATRREFARYLDISIKSGAELNYRLQLARDDGSLSYKAWRPLSEETIEVRKMLFALRRTVIEAEEADEAQRRGRRKRNSHRLELKTNNERPKTDD